MIADVQSGTVAAPDGATVIDCGGRVLMPSLIDAHFRIMLTATPMPVLLTADPADIHFHAAAEARRTLTWGLHQRARPWRSLLRAQARH